MDVEVLVVMDMEARVVMVDPLEGDMVDRVPLQDLVAPSQVVGLLKDGAMPINHGVMHHSSLIKISRPLTKTLQLGQLTTNSTIRVVLTRDSSPSNSSNHLSNLNSLNSLKATIRQHQVSLTTVQHGPSITGSKGCTITPRPSSSRQRNRVVDRDKLQVPQEVRQVHQEVSNRHSKEDGNSSSSNRDPQALEAHPSSGYR